MRLDTYMVAEGLISGRDRAAEAVKDGFVLVNGKAVRKPSYKLKDGDVVDYDISLNVISRAQTKLLAAMENWQIDVKGLNALDIGASTGGFTRALLDRGATYVVALDVGHGQLHESLKSDERVYNLEGYNFKDIVLSDLKLSDRPEVVTMDVSFISITKLIEPLKKVFKENTLGIILIKPQFEAGKSSLSSKGVVRNQKDHLKVLERVVEEFTINSFNIKGIMPSPIEGGEGNKEYLMLIEGLYKDDVIKNYGLKINELMLKSMVEEAFKA